MKRQEHSHLEIHVHVAEANRAKWLGRTERIGKGKENLPVLILKFR